MICRNIVILIILNYFLIVESFHKIPTGFKFGAATAAYQIEGGWNASGE